MTGIDGFISFHRFTFIHFPALAVGYRYRRLIQTIEMDFRIKRHRINRYDIGSKIAYSQNAG